MFAMQHGFVVVGIETVVNNGLGDNGLCGGQRLPCAIPYPQSLFLACVLDVIEADGGAVLFELVFDFTGERERLGTRKVYIAILQGLTVVDRDGDEAAGLRLAFVAGPLEYRNRAEAWHVFGLLGDL